MARSTPALEHDPKNAVESAPQHLSSRKKRPPPINIPVNTTSRNIQAMAPPPALVAIELSNYPPSLTRQDILSLFSGFRMADDFIWHGEARRFVAPLRTTLWAIGVEEANRVVMELNGKMVGERAIGLKILDQNSWETKEASIETAADELKIGIINTARVYHPGLANQFLEIRETTDGTDYMVFLQARDPVKVSSKPSDHTAPIENAAKWQFIAAGLGDMRTDKESSGRIEALKDLQVVLEKQSILHRIWTEWEGCWKLDLKRE